MDPGPETIDGFLEAVAAKKPTPGGGAVAAVTSALGCSLARMVVNYSVGRRDLAMHEPTHRAALDRLTAMSGLCLAAAREDAEAYGALNALWKLAEDDPVRARRWSTAVANAIAAPRSVLDLAIELLDLLHDLLGTTNRFLDSDLAMAAILADAAARSAACNIRINLPLLDGDRRHAVDDETGTLLEHARARCEAIEQAAAA